MTQASSPNQLATTPPANPLELAAAAAGVQLNDLPILKDHPAAHSAQQRSKLLQLLSDGEPLGHSKAGGLANANLSRQASYQPPSGPKAPLQSQFSQPSPFNQIGHNNTGRFLRVLS